MPEDIRAEAEAMLKNCKDMLADLRNQREDLVIALGKNRTLINEVEISAKEAEGLLKSL